MFNEHISSIVGDVPPDVALPQVWLDDDDDRARAEAVLREYQVERNRRGSVRCAHCREDNPATFELCGAVRAPGSANFARVGSTKSSTCEMRGAQRRVVPTLPLGNGGRKTP